MVTSVRIHGRGRPLAIEYFCQGRNRGCMDEITRISLNLSRAFSPPPIGIDMTPGVVAFQGMNWRLWFQSLWALQWYIDLCLCMSVVMMGFNVFGWIIVAVVQRWRMTHITDGFSRTTENMQIVHRQKMANYHRHHFVLSFSAAAE